MTEIGDRTFQLIGVAAIVYLCVFSACLVVGLAY